LLVRAARQLGRRGDLALLVRRLQRRRVPLELEPARRALIMRLQEQCAQATQSALVSWPRRERLLIRLLAE
jgi:hypothetical protein